LRDAVVSAGRRLNRSGRRSPASRNRGQPDHRFTPAKRRVLPTGCDTAFYSIRSQCRKDRGGRGGERNESTRTHNPRNIALDQILPEPRAYDRQHKRTLQTQFEAAHVRLEPTTIGISGTRTVVPVYRGELRITPKRMGLYRVHHEAPPTAANVSYHEHYDLMATGTGLRSRWHDNSKPSATGSKFREGLAHRGGVT